MNVYDEKKPTNFQGVERCKKQQQEKTRHNRRALSVLNQSFVGAQKAYPCVFNKRGFPHEHHGVCETKAVDMAHRPITRRCALQLSCSSQQHLQEPKKQKPSIASTNEFGDCIFIDEDVENKASTDQPVPMLIPEQTEASTPNDDDMEQMEEVEMEDIIEDPVMDIDAYDIKNPLAVVDYVEDLYTYYNKMESFSCVSPSYMSQQVDINEKMRAILIDWLIEVHDKFDLMKETLFLTVNLIDRFLSKQIVMRKKLQLVGLVAMLLACKYEEVSVPIVGDLILISDKAYTRQQILDMEKLMLKTLQFNLSLPTPHVFMQRFLKAAQSDKKVELLSYFLVELSLVEYGMIKFPPSLLAASAIYTAHTTVYRFKQWSKTSERHTNYAEDQLLECSRQMVSLHKTAGTGKLTGVYRKYSTSKYGYASSTYEPAMVEKLQETQQQEEQKTLALIFV